jgi:endo-1,4-beta-xylanase
MGSALALAACKGEAPPAAAQPADLPPLKAVAPLPMGTALMTGQLADAEFQRLLLTNFGQVTPEYEMKMEAVLKEDGTFDFRAADAVAGFCQAHGLRLHGHTLIWYDQAPVAFRRIDGQGRAFADAYRNYILAVAGRYRGRCSGWDVVNEPVLEEGGGYRDCLWSRNFGIGYVAEAFRCAREADPSAVLFLNDYNLESKPAKRASFLRLAEDVLRSGAPLGGLGTQTHLDADVRPGAIAACIRDLARLGLPIHLSELDCSTRVRGGSEAERAQRQARLYGEAAEAMAALPAAQRYAMTVWGIRDQDSWLRRPPRAGDGSDRPLLFDDLGRPKLAAAAVVQAFGRR